MCASLSCLHKGHDVATTFFSLFVSELQSPQTMLEGCMHPMQTVLLDYMEGSYKEQKLSSQDKIESELPKQTGSACQ